MKDIVLEINGKEYKVKINSFGSEKAKLTVNGEEYEVGLKDLGIREISEVESRPRPKPKAKKNEQKAKKPDSTPSSKKVKAPLPGLILEIQVKEGDEVKAGQDILVMEAMKMENEIQSNQSGIVKSIKVEEGDNVYEGDVLIELE
ncbi:MAG: biotin/lipoyl-binding protein [Candidatus Mcinerneyibacterium aminivorans]|jgi:biotin carboxyl carrier protein|uniref:Biotin/lipoyl-binding protein n=1 Tax=Candidatus Mcinerneyibacterium aminivorans TaxID=2703815 RepID=A0A5D0MLT4_9BACT|nr:MAG: biotin/lipoyl-binding protein [Candidatus Mcinerneyibacterium aminivorans]